MSSGDASVVRNLEATVRDRQATTPATEEQRVRREVAHKEQLLATQFIEDGRHGRKIRRIEWAALVAAMLAMTAILLVALT